MRKFISGAVGLALLCIQHGPAAADTEDARRLQVGLGAQVRSFETMSYSDIRPLTHGETGGRAEASYRISGPWWVSVAGHFGGAWFDYTSPDIGNGPPIGGKIDDFSWLLRGGVDRRRVMRQSATVYFGAGAEYGESRSWLDALNASDEGPHLYVGGGYLKLGASKPLWGPLHGYTEVVWSSYHAHARRARFQTGYNWLGRSMEAGAGLRLMLW